MIKHRTCVECGVSKPLNSNCFGRKHRTMTGYKGICLKCERKKDQK